MVLDACRGAYSYLTIRIEKKAGQPGKTGTWKMSLDDPIVYAWVQLSDNTKHKSCLRGGRQPPEIPEVKQSSSILQDYYHKRFTGDRPPDAGKYILCHQAVCMEHYKGLRVLPKDG